jgi:hypothetical protein
MHANDGATIVSDNCCQCNYAVLRQMVEIGEVEVVYATYHVDVGETPFFVAVDFTRHKIVISIRGTLSMKVGTVYKCNCHFVLFLLFYVIILVHEETFRPILKFSVGSV